MIPHQNPRNTGRTQPSAMQFAQSNSFLTSRSVPPSAPSPAAPDPRNAAFRADIRPDFIQSASPRSGPAPTPQPTAPRSISEQYALARQQLTNPAPVQGFATEKQRRDYAWEVRNNPLGARDAAQDFQRIYQRQPSPQATPPNRPTNFNGPRPRFSA